MSIEAILNMTTSVFAGSLLAAIGYRLISGWMNRREWMRWEQRAQTEANRLRDALVAEMRGQRSQARKTN